jgi:hypothetical protein
MSTRLGHEEAQLVQVGDVLGDGLEAGQEEVADGKGMGVEPSARKLLISGANSRSRVRLSMMSWGACDSYPPLNARLTPGRRCSILTVRVYSPIRRGKDG